MSYRIQTTPHEFYCTLCGKKGIPIHRKANHYREYGHLKKLYCISCGKETNHAECVGSSRYDADMFREEFQAGNFDRAGNRILSFSEWKQSRHDIEETADAPETVAMEEWYQLFGISMETGQALC